jgi:hypothetical protein
MQKIADLCGFPDETNWPGVSKLPFYKTLKPDRPTKRRVKDVFKSYAFLLGCRSTSYGYVVSVFTQVYLAVQ